jgi:hypothetical protein
MRARSSEPRFDATKLDFDLDLTWLPQHPDFLALPNSIRFRVASYLSHAWVKDTVELEASILSQAARAVIGTAGIEDEVKLEIGVIASAEEGTHVAHAVRQLTYTARKRGLNGAIPCGLLLRRLRRATRNGTDRRRQLFCLGASSAVEVNQGALRHLAESELINPFQRFFHSRHWGDEVKHQAAFLALAPVAHRALPPEERQVFVEGIAATARWMGTFDEQLMTRILFHSGVDVSTAVRISRELARDHVPAPVPAGEKLLRAIGEPVWKLVSASGR